MAIKITKSYDQHGTISTPQSGIASSTAITAINQGGSIRDLLINYNAQIQYERNSAKANPVFAIDTNFDIKNTEPITYSLAGVLKTLSDDTSFNTGTTATITATLWGIALLLHNGSAGVVQWATTSAAMAYATEAAAIAALGTFTNLCVPTTMSALGYVTVQAGASLWTAGTDALATGAGGTPANATNYYNDPTINGTFGGWQIGNPAGTVITQ